MKINPFNVALIFMQLGALIYEVHFNHFGKALNWFGGNDYYNIPTFAVK